MNQVIEPFPLLVKRDTEEEKKKPKMKLLQK